MIKSRLFNGETEGNTNYGQTRRADSCRVDPESSSRQPSPAAYAIDCLSWLVAVMVVPKKRHTENEGQL